MSITDAILSLRPNTEWTMSNEDVENIIWHTPNVEPLTLAEVEAESERLEAKAATDKAALLAKLGITADEAKLLLT